MNKKHYARSFFCLLILGLSIFLWGCGEDASEEAPVVDPIQVTITIDYPAKTKIPDIRDQQFRVEEESSALEIIELYGNVNEVSILVDTTNSTLEGINGVISHVLAKNYEWQYKVNGEFSKKSIGDYIAEDGDLLEFVYVRAE